ncbi:MAG: HAD-IC family P-type ATPase, partial [Candidatus Goldbacteria bacterium]|nr:HAD-IC family P-type ATPase [Candidatus Goldiibacteriota bacterium]
LSTSEVNIRQKKYGKNTLPAKEPPSIIIIFFKQFLSPLIYVLLAAGVVSLLIGDTKDAFFIFLVLLINAVIGTYQEYRAEKSAAALQNIIKVRATVLRDGEKIEVDSTELVPGDIVFVESGFKVPADLRILEVNSLEVDESFLTGESVAVLKKETILSENTPTSDKSNMLFAGATITKGRGIGVVVETGINTEVGKIAKTVTEEVDTKTPLIIRMEKFSKQISIVILTCCAVVFFILVGRGSPVKDVFFLVVALAVSAIPEGLPVALTVALSVATQRMLKRNVIVRKLTAVESLGSCTYIASDKTGTLTVNQQTAKEIILPWGQSLNISGQGYNNEGEIKDNKGSKIDINNNQVVYNLILSGILCNEGALHKTNNKWNYFGDAMDIAFLALGYKAGFDSEKERNKYETILEIPYESEKKYAAKFYKLNGKNYAAVKGAVEIVLSFCSWTVNEKNEKVKITKETIEKQALNLAEKGFRVLAVAGGEIQKIGEDGLNDMIFYGLVGFIDPLRPEVIDAVNKCKEAGITVSMVTGDHPVTAFAIAKELGICNSMDEVVTGKQLEELGNPDNPEFVKKVSLSRVFARVAPIQKLQIVDSLIRAGHFVAVTGDGVNDAPAMKKANIGVAMGSGTDVAKDTSSMIVTDDNFASIVAGVEEGRFAYDNVRKVIYLLISTGGAEIILFLMSMIFTAKFFGTGHIEPPLIAIQLLWLNLVTNGVQAAALAFEGGEEGAMKKPPRSPKEGIFNSLMIREVLLSGAIMAFASFGIWYYLLSIGMDAFSARNITLLAMVCLENVHVFNCRSETVSAFRVKISKNYFLVASVIIAQGIHIISMQIPFMQQLLRIQPVSIKEWLIVACLSFVLLFTMEIFKAINNYLNKKEVKNHG